MKDLEQGAPAATPALVGCEELVLLIVFGYRWKAY